MVFKADWTGQVKKRLQGRVQVGVEESRWQSLCRGAPVQWDGEGREASSRKGSHPPPSLIPRTYLGQQHINLCDSVPIQFRSIKQPHIVAPTVLFMVAASPALGLTEEPGKEETEEWNEQTWEQAWVRKVLCVACWWVPLVQGHRNRVPHTRWLEKTET